MKVLKKFMVGVCISSMLVAPTSIFAQEVNTEQPQFTATLETGETIELVPVYENGIMPRVIDTSGTMIKNGATVYFVNKDTGSPFSFASAMKVRMSVSFKTKYDVDMGWVDSNYKVIGSSERWSTSPNTAIYEFTTDRRGIYRPFITSYSSDTVFIDRIEITTNW